MLQGFKDFISRGNVVEMAVGVIIATAFKPVVDAITAVLMGLIGAIFGAPNFDYVGAFTVNGAEILPGAILTQLVNFLLVAAAVYFFVVVPMNKLNERRNKEEEETPADDVALLTEIRDLLQQRNA